MSDHSLTWSTEDVASADAPSHSQFQFVVDAIKATMSSLPDRGPVELSLKTKGKEIEAILKIAGIVQVSAEEEEEKPVDPTKPPEPAVIETIPKGDGAVLVRPKVAAFDGQNKNSKSVHIKVYNNTRPTLRLMYYMQLCKYKNIPKPVPKNIQGTNFILTSKGELVLPMFNAKIGDRWEIFFAVAPPAITTHTEIRAAFVDGTNVTMVDHVTIRVVDPKIVVETDESDASTQRSNSSISIGEQNKFDEPSTTSNKSCTVDTMSDDGEIEQDPVAKRN